MADNFTKASFTLIVTDAEAEVLRHVHEAIALITNYGLEPDEQRRRYLAFGTAFVSCFPIAEAEKPFEAFCAIFSDADYPSLGFSITVDKPNGSGSCFVWIHGDQVDLETAANVIRTVARSALPFGFEYALDCDRLAPGEFGGGYVAISEDTIEYGGSARGLERVLNHFAGQAGHGLVIAMRDAEEGLLFWNNDTGFGSLETATVYSEAEAVNTNLPIADDQPEWLALPVPRA